MANKGIQVEFFCKELGIRLFIVTTSLFSQLRVNQVWTAFCIL
jgi:hypothetical protein